MKGLTSTWTENIYTSQLNGQLVVEMLKVDRSLITPLDIGSCYDFVLPLRNGECKTKTVRVTAIDANHIRGSVMFLFQGKL